MTNAEIANQLFVDEDEINPVSSCYSAAVSDPSGEGIEGRCTDCGEMCSIVGVSKMTPSNPQKLSSEEPRRIAREIVEFEFQDPRHMHMSAEMLVEKYAKEIESYASQARREGELIYKREADYYKKLWEQVVRAEELKTSTTMVLCAKCSTELEKGDTKDVQE